MLTIEVQVRRFSVVSPRPFEEIVRTFTATIGHPDINAFHSAVAAARTLSEGRGGSRSDWIIGSGGVRPL